MYLTENTINPSNFALIFVYLCVCVCFFLGNCYGQQLKIRILDWVENLRSKYLSISVRLLIPSPTKEQSWTGQDPTTWVFGLHSITPVNAKKNTFSYYTWTWTSQQCTSQSQTIIGTKVILNQIKDRLNIIQTFLFYFSFFGFWNYVQ